MNLKIIYKVFFVVNFILFLDCKATSQELFLQANAFYKKGDFKKAVDLYQSIENKGAAVLYNLGNCYYHLERYTDALLYWKRALKNEGLFLQEAVDYNCNAVYQKLGIIPSISLVRFLVQKSNDYAKILWLFFLVILSIFFALSFSLSGRKQFFILILFTFFMSISSCCLGIKYWMTTQNYALVSHETSVIAGTDERFTKIGTLVAGQEVLVHEKKDNWCKVKSNNCTGWILAENIEYI
jgi:tetratricopeptide (TPR) repeat protein